MGPQGAFGLGAHDAVPPTPARPRRLGDFDDIQAGDRRARERFFAEADVNLSEDDGWRLSDDDDDDDDDDANRDALEPVPFSFGRGCDDFSSPREKDPRGGRDVLPAMDVPAAREALPPRRSRGDDRDGEARGKNRRPFRAPRLRREDSLSQTKLLAQAGLHRSASLRAEDGKDSRIALRVDGGAVLAASSAAVCSRDATLDSSAAAAAAAAAASSSSLLAPDVSSPFTFHDHFEFKSLLGKTPTSEAWLARSKLSKALYCVKRITRRFQNWRERERCLHEVAAVTNLPAHENVVKYYRAWQEDRCFFAQMELCERGSFGGCLEKLKRLETVGFDDLDAAGTPARLLAERDVWRFAAHVASGLAHCHAHGVLHLDIKPDNVFIDKDGVYKIGDFGVAWVADKGWEVQDGDGGFVAPEVLRGETTRSSIDAASSGERFVPTDRADVFSFGATLYEAAVGIRVPSGFRSGVPTFSEASASANGAGYWDGFEFPDGRSDELRAYVSMCLRAEPSHRPTASALAKHARMILETFA
jgi:membrane-associated tyrosine/threonine-specific cdc2-inhibitory kinase